MLALSYTFKRTKIIETVIETMVILSEMIKQKEVLKTLNLPIAAQKAHSS